MQSAEQYVSPRTETAPLAIGAVLADSYVTGSIGDSPWDDYVEGE